MLQLAQDRSGEGVTPGALISIVIPCRNEAKYIQTVMGSALNQQLGNYVSEVLVVDGMSDDGTREIIRDFAKNNPIIKFLDNPRRIKPTGLNEAIRQSRGEVVIIMDAHSEYPPDYVKNLVDGLKRLSADNVGGVIESLPEGHGVIAEAIAEAMSNPFGVGNSLFRIGGTIERKVDTVPFGCYRKDVFSRIGFFAEELVRNQDDEFNSRLVKAGGNIWLLPTVVSRYYVRNSIEKLNKMLFQYGLFKPLVNRKVGRAATIRQFAPPLFVLTLIVGSLLTFLQVTNWMLLPILALYLGLGLVFAAKASMRRNRYAILPLLPMVFLCMHVSYGIGYLIGIIRYGIMRESVDIDDVPMNR